MTASDDIGFNRLCHRSDFPRLAAWMQDASAPWQAGREERKQWEVAMAIRSFRELVHAPAPRAIGVGAGVEPTLFWLTNHCSEVHATDLYLASREWQSTAPPDMLIDPEKVWRGFPWKPRRLVVQHMDGRALRYEDETFDFVFSSSSIEHFGKLDDVKRAMAEIGRVLRPGGVASLSTEFRFRGDLQAFHNVLLFDAAQIQELIKASGLAPVDPLDLAPDLEVPILEFKRTIQDIQRTGTLQTFPSINFHYQGGYWTSIHLALAKGA